MAITDNFSISRLFVTKTVNIQVSSSFIAIHLKTLRDFYNNDWNSTFHLWTLKEEEQSKIVLKKVTNHFDFLTSLIFDFRQYKEYYQVTQNSIKFLQEILPDLKLDYAGHKMMVGSLELNAEIWDYVLYLLKKSLGEKAEKPLVFESEEARQFYLAQKANEERIAKIRSQKEGDPEALAKILLSINYAFPGLSIEYLLDQTMAQIQWLQKLAAGSVSYEVNAKVFAAGNMKKGSKLDFFIK